TALRSPSGPAWRAHAQATPRPTPSSVDTAVKASVSAAPRSSSGHCWRTAVKSSATTSACSVGQLPGRPAKPLERQLVEVARGLGGGNDLVDLRAQLVLALGHADE